MRKLVSVLLSCCVVIAAILPGITANAAYNPDFEVSSGSALLIDMETGKAVYSKDPDKQCYPASLTKIMTALITLEMIPDDQLVTTKYKASYSVFNELAGQNASNADIRPNEEVSALDLLYGLLLPSGCEAAGVLADSLGTGDTYEERTADFVRRMNEKAKEIGCSDKTHFSNPHGLHHPDQTMTANDLWKILNYMLRNDKTKILGDRFLKITTQISHTMPATDKHPKGWTVWHSARALTQNYADNKYYSPYIKPIKTGTIDEAGRNLVTMGTNKGSNYIFISMHAPSVYENGDPIADNLAYLDHKNIYKWVFNNFELKTVITEETTAGQVKVALGKDKDTLLLAPQNEVISLLPKHVDESAVLKVTTLPEEVTAPIKKGQQIGTLDLKLNDEVIATVPLVATESIERSGFLYFISQIKSFFGSVWFKGALIVILIFLIVYIALIIRYNKTKKRKKRIYSRRSL